MAPRGRKQLKKSSAATSGATRRVPSGPAEQDEQRHLPSELLEMIFSRLELIDNIRASAAFSAPPTNPDCTLFTVRHIINAVLAITTCKIGDNQWTTTTYQTDPPFTSSIWNKLVFRNGRFYFLTLIGWLGIFDPIDKTLMISVPPPRCIELFHLGLRWRYKFMAEHNGDIYLIYTCGAWEPFVYKLNLEKREWDQDRSLKGTTIFATFVSSCVRSDLVGDMAGKVYFPMVRFWGKRCVTYSPKIDRYAPRNELHDWGEVDPFRSVWIEAPKDVSMFLKGCGYKGKGKNILNE